MIHRENIKKIANALTISENDIQYEDQYKSYTIYEKKEIIIKDEFGDIQIDIPIKFYKCHIKFNSNFFKKDINISLEFYKCKFINTNTILCNFNKKIYFKECEFLISEDKLKDINEICISSKFLHGVDFSDTKFNHSINFANSAFYNNTNFRNTKFESSANFKYSKFNGTIDFSNTIFKDNVYFNNSIFQDFADFHECEFEKTANFYGVKFDKAPNFSQAQFKGSLNAVNANLNFDFENLENKIYEEYKTYNRIASENNENLGYIKRFFKYLISFFTKASKDTEKYQKPIEHFANDFRDSFRVFKNALIEDNNLLDASNFHKCELYCKEVELDSKKTKTLRDKVDKLQLWFYRNLCDHHTDILKSFHSLMLVIGLFGLMSLVVIAGFDYCLGYKPILSHLYMIKEIYDAHIHFFIETHTLCTFLFNIFILGVYLLMLFISIKWKIPRRFLIGVSYAIVICILLVSPKILIPAMGIFTDKRVLLDPLSTLGGIYTIVFGFVLFSFIKTIRKNSIVPS